MALNWVEIRKEFSNNIGEYAKGSWSHFKDLASIEIGALSEYYALGERHASIVRNNISSILNANKLVKHNDKFTYYDKDSQSSNPSIAKTVENSFYDGNLNVTVSDGDIFTTNKFGSSMSENMYGAELLNISEGGKEYFLGRTHDFGQLKSESSEGLIKKTVELFNYSKDSIDGRKLKTIISRFHSNVEDENSPIQTSVSSKYGLSKGRNLLKVVPENDENGYVNPYCRVWTYHHEYSQIVKDTIRPLVNSNGDAITQSELEESYNWKQFRSGSSDNFKSGGNRLADNGAMYNDNSTFANGFVNITPKSEGQTKTSIKHCMFSIENLAWKGMFNDYDSDDEYGLSAEQKGPLGGRIMWFPPYDLTFNENVSATYDSVNFIGRGEPILTYANTTRSGSIGFKMLIDHPAILDYWDKKNNQVNENASGVDNIDSNEQTLLRFFAGCSVLTASKPKESIPYVNHSINGIKKSDTVPLNSFKFIVYFPNNYSGVDDNDSNSVVNPIEYLMNGVGTQKVASETNAGQSVDLPTNIENKYTNESSEVVGGYELRANKGISIIKNIVSNNTFANVKYDNTTIALKKIKDYCYRCDSIYEDQIFHNNISYVDTGSTCFNSSGYEKAMALLYEYEDNNTPLYSFADAYVALEGHDTKFTDVINKTNVETIKGILSGSKGTIVSVDCIGKASIQGSDVNKNTQLATHRAETIKKWLKTKLSNDVIVNAQYNVIEEKDNDKKDANIDQAKVDRSVMVEVFYSTSSVEDAINVTSMVSSSGTIDQITYVNNSPNQSSDSSVLSASSATTNEVKGLPRYDNEATFFQALEKNDPFMTRLLCERIKYFNPAFHSLSPEGFNARLTFLHQCTRQGPTMAASELSSNASNLSFGRPPICVLRIGDFYNTKIAITSLTITYDTLTWDLNQEGIGVMPMIANITLSFTFLGGSDLAGPIQRLQNAASFNYYANTSVYDNRAEEIEYENGGKVKNFKANPNTSIIMN